MFLLLKVKFSLPRIVETPTKLQFFQIKINRRYNPSTS
ncbi:hypothetical protein LEP1GSC016_1006 [Leptospira borgpetersenii serovar Hardjo-bovis str. Sponselee]|uniref:Uncharacterized protein n=2 Tax=Leptospira borgpetersenii TaxID=174 RepID=M6BE84_LEPBO|nr:hypothetical protein LEP1GSC016_1006 [Leptospira borgpetersenii serovar Hardjo-bovis str. Sponselee]EMO65023.1 hypothetical protein LEP1GSC133_3715 [Leptospira borgpetersenii serovar Pomona str. 200901868]